VTIGAFEGLFLSGQLCEADARDVVPLIAAVALNPVLATSLLTFEADVLIGFVF